jgi:hypothetical protein
VPTWPQASLSAGFTHVQDTQPEGAEEGATWYDLGSNEAKVYDGAEWRLLTVTSHAELSDVSTGQHRSDANVRATVDGAVDADTVDGSHASDLGAPNSTQGSSAWETAGTYSFGEGQNHIQLYVTAVRAVSGLYGGESYTVEFYDGETISGSHSQGSTTTVWSGSTPKLLKSASTDSNGDTISVDLAQPTYHSHSI